MNHDRSDSTKGAINAETAPKEDHLFLVGQKIKFFYW